MDGKVVFFREFSAPIQSAQISCFIAVKPRGNTATLDTGENSMMAMVCVRVPS